MHINYACLCKYLPFSPLEPITFAFSFIACPTNEKNMVVDSSIEYQYIYRLHAFILLAMLVNLVVRICERIKNTTTKFTQKFHFNGNFV